MFNFVFLDYLVVLLYVIILVGIIVLSSKMLKALVNLSWEVKNSALWP